LLVHIVAIRIAADCALSRWCARRDSNSQPSDP
jgi:hypothetical protein